MKTFKMRTTKPEAGNKYYITRKNGGYSDAIQGKPTDRDCDVLSNCVGYAYGRFNEIGDYGCCKYLYPTNAENFIQHAGGLEVGQTPKVGACMVWQRGNTLSGSDGAGHVAIVEKVISDTEVYTSESGWNSQPFWNQTRKKGSGNWGQNSSYKFLGFIYNPATKDIVNSSSSSVTTSEVIKLELTMLSKGMKGNKVRALQALLIGYGYSCGSYGADGDFGSATLSAVKKYQKAMGLAVDGIVGKNTWSKLLGV